MGAHVEKCQLTKTQRIQVTSFTKYCVSPSISVKALLLSTAVLYPLIQGTNARVLQFISIVSPGRALRYRPYPWRRFDWLFGGAPNQIEQRGRKPVLYCSRL
jgi:hypothetical protein